MKDLFKFPLNIQLFGDELASETTEGQENSDGEETKQLTQSDIDRAVSAAVKTRDEKHALELKKAVTNAINEEKRLSALSEEDRKNEALEKANQAIADKEKELDLKILRLDVGEVLVKRGLDPELLDFVLGDNLEASIAKIDKLSKSIDNQVGSRIKQVVAKPGVPTKSTGKVMTKAEIMAIKDDAERQKQIALHPELFNYGG